MIEPPNWQKHPRHFLRSTRKPKLQKQPKYIIMKFLIVIALTIAAVTAKNIICTPGSVFKMDCNTCTCSPDGLTAACTDMACPKVTPKSQLVCEPRSQFKDYCNTCFCSEDGSSVSCTRMMCDKEIWNPDGTLKVVPESNRLTRSPKQVCTSATQFKDYCNTCGCSEDGLSFACTRMECDKEIWNQDGSLKVATNSKQVCEPRSQSKAYCNTCFCSEDGLSISCTRMECDKEIWNQDGSLKVVEKSNKLAKTVINQVCEPSKQFKDYCNTCFCSDDGSTYSCTRMMCDKEIWNQDGSLKVTPESNRVARSAPKQICEPSKQFKDYCNTCFCSDDGSTYSCTRMMCDKEIWNQDGSLKIVPAVAPRVCEPNTHFMEKCNSCVCSTDGLHKACTFKLCLSSLQRAFKIEESQNWGPVYQQGDSCTPGKAFYSECNRCVCTSKGNSAYCTLMKCPTGA